MLPSPVPIPLAVRARRALAPHALLALTALFCAAAPANAKSNRFNSLPPRVIGEDESRRVSAQFGRCLAQKGYRDVRKAVLEDWSNEDVADRLERRAFWEDCAFNVASSAGSATLLDFPGDTLRQQMALGLYARDLAGRTPRGDLTAVAPLTYPALQASIDRRAMATPVDPGLATQKHAMQKSAELAALAKGQMAMYAVTECAVRASPPASAAFLDSAPSTAEERIAPQSYAEHLSRCVPATMRLTAPIARLRGALALVYYRLAGAAGALPQVGSR